MKHILQKVRNTKTGDCLNACIASILEIDLQDIPSFNEIENPEEWWRSVQDWAQTIGFQLLYIQLNAHTCIYAMKETLCIGIGITAKGALHAVVGYARGSGGNQDFMQLHDPLDKNGVESIDAVIYLVPIHPEKHPRQ